VQPTPTSVVVPVVPLGSLVVDVSSEALAIAKVPKVVAAAIHRPANFQNLTTIAGFQQFQHLMLPKFADQHLERHPY
jgi:hypothetical protein